MPDRTTVPPRIYLKCLGDLVVFADGKRLGEARRKPLAILAYLAAEAPRPVNRETLASLMWPESSPDRARRALAQTLYAIRRECGEATVVGTSQLTLDPTIFRSDLAEFADALRNRDFAAARTHYGGPFLDGFAMAGARDYEEWAEGMRTRLALQHHDALLEGAALAFERDDHATGIQWLHDCHAMYPDDPLVTERLALQYLMADAAHLAAHVIDMFEERLAREHELPLPTGLQDLRRRLHGPNTQSANTHSSNANAPLALEASGPSHGHTQREDGANKDDHRSVQHSPASRWPLRWSVGVVMLPAVAALIWFRPWISPVEPATLDQLSMQVVRKQRDAVKARIDTADIGTVIILPPRTAYRSADLDSLLPAFLMKVHARIAWSRNPNSSNAFRAVKFTKALSPDELAHHLDVLGGAVRTTHQIAALLKRTGAALAVQPLVEHWGPDSVRVSYDFYRDYSHAANTHGDSTGSPPLEFVSGRATVGWTGARWTRTETLAIARLMEFLWSMESCHPAWHTDPRGAPWCWTAGRRLRIALTAEQAMERAETERLRAQQAIRLQPMGPLLLP